MTEVLTQSQDGVLIITINRPEAKNAVNQAVAQGIAAAMEQLDGDTALNAGIITGAGGTFCSGMDLKAFLQRRASQHQGQRLCRIRRGTAEKASHRRGRGVRAGWRDGDRHRLRSARRQ